MILRVLNGSAFYFHIKRMSKMDLFFNCKGQSFSQGTFRFENQK